MSDAGRERSVVLGRAGGAEFAYLLEGACGHQDAERVTAPRLSIAVSRDERKAAGVPSHHDDVGSDLMTEDVERPRTVSATREVAAPADAIFELIADPAQQPRWDGNDNLVEAPVGQRIHGMGDVFTMVLSNGSVRENHVVEFEEGRRIAWRPADPGSPPAGHLWRWELEPTTDATTRVTHTYDWSQLTDSNRFAKARSTSSDDLDASLVRLARLAEEPPAS